MDFHYAGRLATAEAMDCCLDVVRSGRFASGCISCPYKNVTKCRELMLTSGRNLLRQPEKVNVEIRNKYWATCKECYETFRIYMIPAQKAHFCPNCGMELKWNDKD